jgi:class 3 adenylate cyclase
VVATGNRILPRYAKLSPDSPKELAKHIDPILAEDLRKIQISTVKQVKLTVVFWDISGFSSLCEDFAVYPRILIDFLRKYFVEAIRIIKKYNGVLDKFMGDGILAYFGYNGTEDGDPRNAINAALEFKKQFSTLKADLAQLCKEMRLKKVRRIDLKCGMNIGYAYVHYFNTTARNSVIFMGSTLNLASRLEGIAKKDEIIVSRKLKDMIQGQYEFTPISVKRRGNIKSFKSEKVVYTIKGKRKG